MLKKQNRVTTRHQFNITRRLGKRFQGKFFHLFILEPRNYRGPAQVGIVIPNKLDKSAVRRNTIKRRYRECIRNNFDKINPNQWLVFHPRFNSQDIKYEELCADISQTLQKISIPK